MTLYSHACFEFCNTLNNQTDVLNCILDAVDGKQKDSKVAVAFNNTNGGKHQGPTDDESFAAPAALMSKSAVGLAVMMGLSMVVGTL